MKIFIIILIAFSFLAVECKSSDEKICECWSQLDYDSEDDCISDIEEERKEYVEIFIGEECLGYYNDFVDCLADSDQMKNCEVEVLYGYVECEKEEEDLFDTYCD